MLECTRRPGAGLSRVVFAALAKSLHTKVLQLVSLI
jgi:hypothetical protein